MSEGGLSARPYVVTWAALVALAGLTFWLSSVELGALYWPIALGIAAVKAVLIALVFMHLRESQAANRLVFVVGVLFVVLLVVFSSADVATRGVARRLPRQPPGPLGTVDQD
jgi:cytochrome c oxidase subunit 4